MPKKNLKAATKKTASKKQKISSQAEDRSKPVKSQRASSTKRKQEIEDTDEIEGFDPKTAKPIENGVEPDIGDVVKAKVKDKWYTAQIVKLERHGISKKYAVKGFVVIFDRDIPCAKKTYDVGSRDMLLTGEHREVRYWSSGTPCMRATGVDTHATKVSENSLLVRASSPIAKNGTTAKKMKNGSNDEFVLPTTKYGGKQAARDSLSRADDAAAKLLLSLPADKFPSTAQMTKVFAEIGEDWPTQDRPNVTPNGRPVTGFCLGCVFVLGGGGMQSSNISLAFPNLCKCITGWVKGSLPEPDFPFSSIQINYNYMAKRHVDGNNIGPSYIYALGDHQGGDLWTADQYIATTDPNDGSTLMRSGGGEGILTCRHSWALFNGNMEHETQPITQSKGKAPSTRISVIVFSNNNYNILPPNVVREMEALGFTAQSSSGEDLPYFKKYRIDKKEFTAQQNKSYIGYLMERSKLLPPPNKSGKVCIECFGLTMNRGGGWMSVMTKAKGREPTIFDLEPNRTGFHVLELECLENGDLDVISTHINNDRFNIYKDEIKEVSRFTKFINQLPQGRVVLITITDTAIAAKRPPGKDLYDALTKIGAAPDIERIGYRQPFALIGCKGMAPGTANYAMDKTKILLRMEATVGNGRTEGFAGKAKKTKTSTSSSSSSTGAITLSNFSCERTDINELKLTE